MKIKTWFIWIITGTVSLFLLLQVCFYFMFQKWNNNMRDSLIEATARQSAERVEDLYKSVEDVSINLMTDSNVLNYLFGNKTSRTIENYNRISYNISSLVFANKDIKYVALLDNKDILLNISQGGEMMHSLIMLEEVKKDIKDIFIERNNHTFVKAYQYKHTNHFAYVSQIRTLDLSIDSITQPCYIVILFEVGEMENYLESVFDRKKFMMRVLDYNNTILFSGYEEEFGQIFKPEIHVADSWCKMVTMQQPEWKLCFSIPKTNIGSNQGSFLTFMLLLVILNILLLILMINILIRNISESISDIEKEIAIICSGKWGHRIRYKKNNEINSIANSFNTLLDEYEAMIRKNSFMEEEVHKSKLLRLEAQIEQLQEKISPHFLYNSMEYIKGVAQEHGIEKIVDITSVLSQNFRYNMDDSKDATVKEDLFYALSYFNVVNSRRKHPIRLQFQIPGTIMEQRIIKMVFQPILENTLKHGDLGENGVVTFSGVERDDGVIDISVKDNGCGISADTLAKLRASLSGNVNYLKDDKGDHQGILNVHTRLELTYGSGCGITILSHVGEGTEIIITFRHNN